MQSRQRRRLGRRSLGRPRLGATGLGRRRLGCRQSRLVGLEQWRVGLEHRLVGPGLRRDVWLASRDDLADDRRRVLDLGPRRRRCVRP